MVSAARPSSPEEDGVQGSCFIFLWNFKHFVSLYVKSTKGTSRDAKVNNFTCVLVQKCRHLLELNLQEDRCLSPVE